MKQMNRNVVFDFLQFKKQKGLKMNNWKWYLMLEMILLRVIHQAATTLSLGCMGVDLGVSDDGNILGILCTDNNLYMYHWTNGTIYSLNKTLPHITDVRSVSVLGDGEKVVVNRNQAMNGYWRSFNYAMFLGSGDVGVDRGDVLYHQASDHLFSSAADSIFIMLISSSAVLTNLTEPTTVMNELSCSITGQWLVGVGGTDMLIYNKTDPSTFVLQQTISFSGRDVRGVQITDDSMYIYVVMLTTIGHTTSEVRTFKQQSDLSYIEVHQLASSIDFEFIVVSSEGKVVVGGETTVRVYLLNQTNDRLEAETQFACPTILSLALSIGTDELFVLTTEPSVAIYRMNTEPEPEPEPSNNTSNVTEDAEKNNQKNEEQVSKLMNVLQKIFSLVSVFRNRKVKFLFFAIDNFWLYEYHKEKYTWLTTQVFSFIREVQSKKPEVIDAEQLPFIEESIMPSLQNYTAQSNEKFAAVEGSDNGFLRNTVEYFVINVPYCLLVFVLLNRLFYGLFNYSISQYLRMFSFWGFLYQMLVESNVEYFSFLGFRSLQTMFSSCFHHKLQLVFSVLFFYVVVAGTISSYFLYRYFYGKLSKYFMSNVFRIKGAITIMTFLYGIRPFLKGVIHAYLYHYNRAQLLSLAGLEFLTCLMLVAAEVGFGVFIFKSVFFCEFLFYFSLGSFNLLLLQSRLAQTDELVDFYLQVTGIIITFITLAKVILEFTLCREFVEVDLGKEILGSNKMKVKLVVREHSKQNQTRENQLNRDKMKVEHLKAIKKQKKKKSK